MFIRDGPIQLWVYIWSKLGGSLSLQWFSDRSSVGNLFFVSILQKKGHLHMTWNCNKMKDFLSFLIISLSRFYPQSLTSLPDTREFLQSFPLRFPAVEMLLRSKNIRSIVAFSISFGSHSRALFCNTIVSWHDRLRATMHYIILKEMFILTWAACPIYPVDWLPGESDGMFTVCKSLQLQR